MKRLVLKHEAHAGLVVVSAFGLLLGGCSAAGSPDVGESAAGKENTMAGAASASAGAVASGGTSNGSAGSAADTSRAGSGGTSSVGSGGTSRAGSGGTSSVGGASSTSNGGRSGGVAAPSAGAPKLPTAAGPCAPFTNGKMTIQGVQASVWVGTPTVEQKGPVVIYWHGTGTSGQEAKSALGSAALAEIVAGGGIVVAPEASTKQGTNTGDAVWYTGDFAIADQVVACASELLHTDPRRIHSLGYSAGGLQTAWMSSARSNYLASVVSYSGGVIGNNVVLQDPDNVPPALCAHGGAGSDVFILDFARASQTYEQQIRKRGGFAIDCDDGGTHVDIAKRFKVAPSAWQFLKDHPFGARPEPYGDKLPTDFPTYCKIVP